MRTKIDKYQQSPKLPKHAALICAEVYWAKLEVGYFSTYWWHSKTGRFWKH